MKQYGKNSRNADKRKKIRTAPPPDEIRLTGALRDAAGIRRFYGRYTVVFVILAFCSFAAYIFSGRTLIWIDDAWSQHFKAFVYYSEYLRSAIGTLFREGRLVLPDWEFGFGEGGDVLATLHYYVIGDPLTVLSALVPVKYLHLLFDFLTLVRMYLAGALFSYYCILMGQKNETAVTVGAFVYSFSHWAILNAGRHPYFLNPMVYFPLILIGIEFVIRKRRPYLLTVAVAISALSNFYFFYMLALLAAFSVFARVIYLVRGGLSDVKEAVVTVLRVAFWSVLGVLISAAIMIPVAAFFLQESRAGVDYAVGILYPLSYYTKLPGILAGEGGAGAMTGEFWLCAGFSVVTLPCIIILFRGRSHKFTKFLLITSAVAICIPAFGYALNGFSYVTNRWIWALALLAAFVVTMTWHRLATVNRRDYICILTVECALLLLCLVLEGSRTLGGISSAILTIIMLIRIYPGKPGMTPKKRERIMSVFACFSIVFNSLSFTSFWGMNYAEDHVELDGIAEKLYDNETAYVKRQAEKSDVTDFYRYSGYDLTQNAGALVGLSSTQYYWSLSNPNVIARNSDLGLRDYLFNAYSGHDGRTIMNTLSSVRYFAQAKGSPTPVPYGFDMYFPESVEEEYYIYENRNALPLGYTYGSVIDAETWEKMNPWEKEDAMLYGAFVDGGADGLPTSYTGDVSSESAPYTVECLDDYVTYEDGKIVVTQAGAAIELNFERMRDVEIGVSFTDFAFRSTAPYDLYFGGDDVDPEGRFGREEWGELSLLDRIFMCNDRIFWTEPTGVTLKVRCGTIDNTMQWFGPDYQFYNGRDDFYVNLGYHFSGITSLLITFPRPGTYTFDSLDVIYRPMGHYENAVDELKKEVLTDISIGTDTVSGKITLEDQKLLLLTIPYSGGWTATVDGKPAEILRTNICYMGFMLGKGEHTVELRYETPLKNAGLAVSAVGVAAFVLSIAIYEIRDRRKKRGEKAEP